MVRIGWQTTAGGAPEIDLAALGAAPSSGADDPMTTAQVIKRLGDALDLTDARISVKIRALRALCDELEDRISEHAEFEPSFSRRFGRDRFHHQDVFDHGR